jgi:hypothetical protein
MSQTDTPHKISAQADIALMPAIRAQRFSRKLLNHRLIRDFLVFTRTAMTTASSLPHPFLSLAEYDDAEADGGGLAARPASYLQRTVIWLSRVRTSLAYRPRYASAQAVIRLP